jgi:hypothetical protein
MRSMRLFSMKLHSRRASTQLKTRGHHVILVDYQPTSDGS